MALVREQHALEAAAGAKPERRGGRRFAIAAGQTLFEAGEAKEGLVYRIRTGALAIEPLLGDGSAGSAPVKVYKAGDFAGLGFLDIHAASARALVPLEVVVWPVAAFERLAHRATRFGDMRDEAVRLEFVWRRAQCVAEGDALRTAGTA